MNAMPIGKESYAEKADKFKHELNGFETYKEYDNLDERERDACGVGFVASVKGERNNSILKQSISALECNDHRGGCNYDGQTGDGAGIMAEIPWDILQKWADENGKGKIDSEHTAVGQFFLQHDEAENAKARAEFDRLVEESKFKLVGWRKVPVNEAVLGDLAKSTVPGVWQPILDGSAIGDRDAIEVASYQLRRIASKSFEEKFGTYAAYIVGMSTRTMIYKGMVLSDVLSQFYLDL